MTNRLAKVAVGIALAIIIGLMIYTCVATIKFNNETVEATVTEDDQVIVELGGIRWAIA